MDEATPPDTPAPSLPGAALHIDQCIAAYAEQCRRRIPGFVSSHFSLEQTWRLQRPTLAKDLVLGPINSLWAIPYLTASRVFRSLDVLGIPAASRILRAIPPGVKTGYQHAVEGVIAKELLDWGQSEPGQGLPRGLIVELERHPELGGSAALSRAISRHALQTVFDQFLSARALVSDVAGAGITLGLGWLFFNAPSLGLMGISEQFARRNARSRAAARFFLGRPAGSVFYSIFRPRANPIETAVILALLAFVIGAAAMACSLLFEPVRKACGLHERKLQTLVDQIERELLVVAQRQIKPALPAGIVAPVRGATPPA